MELFLQTALSFPTAIYSFLLCVAVIYWLVVAAGLLEDGLGKRDELVRKAGLPRGGVDRGRLRTGEVAQDVAGLVIAEGTGGLATRMGGGHWKGCPPREARAVPSASPFPLGVP